MMPLIPPPSIESTLTFFAIATASTPSLARELWLPLLEERAHALSLVFRPHCLYHGPSFLGEGFLQRLVLSADDGPQDAGDSDRRPRRQLLSQIVRALSQLWPLAAVIWLFALARAECVAAARGAHGLSAGRPRNAP